MGLISFIPRTIYFFLFFFILCMSIISQLKNRCSLLDYYPVTINILYHFISNLGSEIKWQRFRSTTGGASVASESV